MKCDICKREQTIGWNGEFFMLKNKRGEIIVLCPECYKIRKEEDYRK